MLGSSTVSANTSIEKEPSSRFHTVTKDFITSESQKAQVPINQDTDSLLIASPYEDLPHLLDLNSLDTQSRLLALALSSFKPIRDDYATAEYPDAFNWNTVFDLLHKYSKSEGHTWKSQSFYVVVFRSKLQPNVDQNHLTDLDAYSHQEAVASGGLLKYWFGTKDEKRQNLATCLSILVL